MSQYSWRFLLRDDSLKLRIDDTDTTLDVESVSLPDTEEYEDEYIMAKCTGVKEKILLSLRSHVDRDCDVGKRASVGELSNAKDFLAFVQKTAFVSYSETEMAFSPSIPDASDISLNERILDILGDNEVIPETPGEPHQSLDDSGVSLDSSFNEQPETSVSKKSTSITGKKMGQIIYATDCTMGLVDEEQECWNGPPPFRKTVGRMRAMLTQKFGPPENWTRVHFMAQQTYFRLLFKLVDDKDKKRGAGGLFRYFKVSRLSTKNWELASAIMDRIEAGSLSKNKRKRSGQTVYQSSFSCLDRLDVSSQDDIIADVLTQYLNNRHEDAMATADNYGPPKKQKTSNIEAQQVPGGSIASSIASARELENSKRIIAELEAEMSTLRQQYSLSQQECDKWKTNCDKLNLKKSQLEKELETLKRDNAFLTGQLDSQHKLIQQYKDKVQALQKEKAVHLKNRAKNSSKAKALPAAKGSETEVAKSAREKLDKLEEDRRECEDDLMDLEKTLDEIEEKEKETEAENTPDEIEEKEKETETEKTPDEIEEKETETEKQTETMQQNPISSDGGKLVAVAYDSSFYVGIVVKDDEIPTVEFLKKSGKKYKKNIKHPEILEINPIYIFDQPKYKLEDNFYILDFEETKQKYLAYKKEFM